ncbi:hypothetical protein [Stakelama saccharophila]|uniref:Uncharacterized protein n=1 Tax=Stakelama saccharophila TaxID=3075605 RepID=A0ABZ0B5W9_9SPHN|nr:hypothetical protein [Stakelama sp. W311]WNO52695.1 hypothetical protein RPR59_09480 [Stakelama sp. W311]
MMIAPPLMMAAQLIAQQAQIAPAASFKSGGAQADLFRSAAEGSNEAFAAGLINAEPFPAWNGMASAAREDTRLRSLSVYGGSGRRTIVYYRPGSAERLATACRVRVDRKGTHEDWAAARRWCRAVLAETGDHR